MPGAGSSSSRSSSSSSATDTIGGGDGVPELVGDDEDDASPVVETLPTDVFPTEGEVVVCEAAAIGGGAGFVDSEAGCVP